jgi:hypothetical protein
MVRFLLLMFQDHMIRHLQHTVLALAFLMLGAVSPALAYSSSSTSDDMEHKVSVRKAIGKNFDELASCLRDFSDSHPDLKEVSLEFLVWTNGQFYNVNLEPGDPVSEQCVEELLKHVQVPYPEEPQDYSFTIDLDAHVRQAVSLSGEVRKDGPEPGKKKEERSVHHTLSLDILTPIVTGSMGLGAVFIFEYELAVNRWVALAFTGVAGQISKDEKIKIQGVKHEGKVEGRGGGGGGGIRVYPLGKAPRGLLLGAQVRAYLFNLAFHPCPDGAEEGQCDGELKNLDVLFEAGWRFVLRFGLAIQLSAEVGAQFGRSLYQFDSDPAFYFGGRADVGWVF